MKTGTKIVIPVHAIHYDSKYYSNPEDFEPERFSEENAHNLHPNTYIPFGDGPRFCIGMILITFFSYLIFIVYNYCMYNII